VKQAHREPERGEKEDGPESDWKREAEDSDEDEHGQESEIEIGRATEDEFSPDDGRENTGEGPDHANDPHLKRIESDDFEPEGADGIVEPDDAVEGKADQQEHQCGGSVENPASGAEGPRKAVADRLAQRFLGRNIGMRRFLHPQGGDEGGEGHTEGEKNGNLQGVKLGDLPLDADPAENLPDDLRIVEGRPYHGDDDKTDGLPFHQSAPPQSQQDRRADKQPLKKRIPVS